MYKNVLITGAMGFIGQHAIKKWSDAGYKIIAVDNLSNTNADISNVNSDNIYLIVSDIQKLDFSKIPPVNMIVHLASPIGTVKILNSEDSIGIKIIKDLEVMIKLAKNNNCPLIFTSTCEIYGEHLEPVAETDSKIMSGEYSVRNEYSVAKLMCEVILSNISKTYRNFKYQIIRPFNVVGKNQTKETGHVIPRFINQALTNQDITVYGNGSQTRCFISIDDFIEALYLVSDSHYFNNIWNIGNPENVISMGELAQIIKQEFNSQSSIIMTDPKSIHGYLFEDSPTKIPNIQKVSSIFNWKPSKNILDIVRDIREY